MSIYAFYTEFTTYLEKKDRLACVESSLQQLADKKIDVVTLYEQVLSPSLKEKFCREKEREVCVWEEHARTSIIRTVIESCYPYLIKERDRDHHPIPLGKALVFCPQEEYHEIGARMVTDFLTLCGYDAIFIGANTPAIDITEAVSYFTPQLVAVSVSNYFNLVAARKALQKIKSLPSLKDKMLQVIAGGVAFSSNPEAYRGIEADRLLLDFDEIKKYTEGIA